MRIEAYGATDVGRKREHNEDGFGLAPELGLFVVADGMGGHAAGEVASARAVEVIQEVVAADRELLARYGAEPQHPELRERCRALVEQAVQAASADVFARAQADPARRGMGSTVVLLLTVGRKGFIAHVGDSRAYLLRHGAAHQLTDDHTLLNAQLKQGLVTPEEAARLPAGVITRSVGYQSSVQVDVLPVDLLPGDRFLLCTDGLSGYIEDGEWAAFLAGAPPAELPDKLIQVANHRGGRDNVTAVVVAVADEDDAGDRQEVEAQLEILRQVPLFRRLHYKELIQVLSIVRIRRVRAAEVLYRAGDSGKEALVVLHGALEVERPGRSADLRGPGALVGEMALVDESPHAATARAAEDSVLLVIERSSFFALLGRDAHLSARLLWAFVQVLAERLRTAEGALPPAE